jgi:membrane-bound lytic murein transglycosylase
MEHARYGLAGTRVHHTFGREASMRVHRHMKTLITLTVFASLAGCASSGRQSDGTSVAISAQWDSGPLDRAYNREHADMVVRQNQETATPRSDESADVRNQRQASERQDLELRYARGKSAHAQTLPDSER